MKQLILYTLIAVIAGLALPSGALAVEATVHTSNATVTVNEAPPPFHHHHFHFHHAHHHRHHHHRHPHHR